MAGDGTKNLSPDVEEKLRKLRFQLYKPHSEELQKFFQEPEDPDAIVDEVSEQNQALIRQMNAKFNDPSLDTDNMVPRKGHWEMKKALSAKMEKLDRRTKRALADIARKQAEGGNLAVGAANEQEQSSDDD